MKPISRCVGEMGCSQNSLDQKNSELITAKNLFKVRMDCWEVAEMWSVGSSWRKSSTKNLHLKSLVLVPLSFCLAANYKKQVESLLLFSTLFFWCVCFRYGFRTGELGIQTTNIALRQLLSCPGTASALP